MNGLLKKPDLLARRMLYLLILLGFMTGLAACKKNDASRVQGTGQGQNNSPTSLVLNKTALTMAPGQTDTLIATFVPANATAEPLTWASSNTAIATVDTLGHVTAQNAGAATITVKTIGGKLTALCTITVNAIPATAIKLNITSFGMYVTETFALQATLVPSNASPQQLVWSSNNTAVATVDANGLVTGKSPGTAVITVKTADGKLSATCPFTIIYATLAGIKLNQTNLSLVVNSSYTLQVSVVPQYSPPQQFVWSSSNQSVAAVNANGVVSTNTTIGRTTITVSTTDGKFSATCLVNVVSNNVTGIKLDSTQFMLLNGTSLKMGYTLSPVGVTNPGITWTSSNTAIATVNTDGTINGLTAGKSNVTAQTNSGGFTSTCTVQVVPIGSYLDVDIFYSTSTSTGQLVESVSFGGFNYSLYDVVVSEIDVYNNENSLIGSLKNSSGTPVFTFTHAAGGGLTSQAQSFVVGQAEPGATTLQHWPMIVYFTCNGVNYKMTLTWVNNATSMAIVQI